NYANIELGSLWKHLLFIQGDSLNYTRYEIEYKHDIGSLMQSVVGTGHIFFITKEYLKLQQRSADLVYLSIKGANPLVVRASLLVSGVNEQDFIMVPFYHEKTG